MISPHTKHSGCEQKRLSRSRKLFALLLAGSLAAGASRAAAQSSNTEEEQPARSPASISSGSESPFSGSVPEGQATDRVLPISFKDAIERALRNNLGLLISSDSLLSAKGQRWRELSHLLPNLSISATQSVTQIDLEALGFRFNFPGVGTVVGPSGTFDARAYLTAPIFDWHAIQRERGARAGESAAQYDYKSARELVVLATGNVYLLTIAAGARVDAAQAQLESAILAANESGALSPDETKELARLGELAKKTRDPVKEDIETLKSVLALPIVGGDAAVRLAPKSQQDAVIRNAEAAKRAVGALLAAIRKLP